MQKRRLFRLIIAFVVVFLMMLVSLTMIQGPASAAPASSVTYVTPVPPTVQPASCADVNEVVTPSSQEGVNWSPAAATVLAPGQSVVYSATPQEGYAFNGDVQPWSYTNTFDESTCYVLGPPPVATYKPTAKIFVSGHTARFTLNNTRSNLSVVFRVLIRRNGKLLSSKSLNVAPGAIKHLTQRHLAHGTRLIVRARGKVLATSLITRR